MVQSADGRPGARERGSERDREGRFSRGARRCARPFPRPQERAQARRCERCVTARPGIALNAVRERLEQAVDARHAALEQADRRVATESLDVTLPGEVPPLGHLHPLTQIIREVEDIFLGLGYEIVDSREVETVWHNFDALNQPLTHPSRSPRDTFYVDDNTLLRTHTSTGQIRVMESRQPPIYIADARPRLPARHAEPEDRRPSSTRSRRWRSTATSRSPTSRARCCTSPARCSARTAKCACGRTSSRSPSLRSSST